MSNYRYASTRPPQPPTRSILKPTRSSHTTAPSSSRSSSTFPAVKTCDPSVPTQAAQEFLQKLPKIPPNGPIPAISIPATQNKEQLLGLLAQLVSQIENIAEEAEIEGEMDQTKASRPQTGRPTYQPDDFPEFRHIIMDPWVPGPCYGPVLEPEVAMKLPTLQINRYLSPPSSLTHGRLLWDVTQPVSTAKFIEDGRILCFDEFCHEPATLPRLTEFQFISRPIPWPSTARRMDELAGVTVGELLSNMSLALTVPMTDRIVRNLSEENHRILTRTHKVRCHDQVESYRVFDLLAGCTMFGGLSYDCENGNASPFPDHSMEIHISVCYLPIS